MLDNIYTLGDLLMVKLIEVDASEISTERLGRRGRVSYPLLKSFLESNVRCVKIDMAGLDKNPAYLRSVLQTYIKSHQLPIKLFAAGGDLHLLRLDMDDKGQLIPDWKPGETTTEGNAGALRSLEAAPITPGEVQERFTVERRQTVK